MLTLNGLGPRQVAKIEEELRRSFRIVIHDLDFGEFTRPSATDLIVIERPGSVDLCLPPTTTLVSAGMPTGPVSTAPLEYSAGTKIASGPTFPIALDRLRESLANTPILSRLSDYKAAAAALASTQARPSLNPDDLAARLTERVVGQDAALRVIADAAAQHVRRKRHSAPLAFALMGDSGTGKTESALALAEILTEYPLIRIDLAEYKDRSSTARLFGSAPGYVEGDGIVEKFARSPRHIALWDEAEKAHPSVLESLLAALDCGRLTRAKTQSTVDIRDAIWIFTTNIAADAIATRVDEANAWGDSVAVADICEKAALAHGWSRPLCGRIDRWAAFRPLAPSTRLKVAALGVVKVANEYDLTVTHIDPSTLANLVARAEGKGIGARGDRHVIDWLLGPAMLAAQDAALNGPLSLVGPPYRLVAGTQCRA